MTILVLFAFLSGVVTIFAPCIWPILPIVLSSGATGGERKPLGIVTGLATSFLLATLALAWVVQIIPFDPDVLRLFAVFVIALLGLTLVIPALGARLEGMVSRFASFGGRWTQSSGTGFWGGFLTGFALGLVWSPCAGPILATIAALAATQAVNFQVVLITVAFVIGVASPLFILAVLGKKILTKTRVLAPYTKYIQQVFGLIMILAAGAIYTGYDKALQTKLLDTFPNYESFLNGLEKNDTVKQKLDELKGVDGENPLLKKEEPKLNMKKNLPQYGQAPEFVGIEQWLNTDSALTMDKLRGKVVLVDFWTYSCINCIRTLPYVTGWYEKYKDQGFVVIGVHTPEFEFEKKTANVTDALEQYKINYPVAQDNRYGTWQAYNNRYWPAHYLIDSEGRIREYHFGEGNYQETEQAIQSLLEEAGRTVGSDTLTGIVADTPGRSQTPETYLGSDRMERFQSPERVTGEMQAFTLPTGLKKHYFAYSGAWKVESERAIAGSNATLSIHFYGKKVFLVMAPSDDTSSGSVKVFLDQNVIERDLSGGDVIDGRVSVDAEKLYELFDGNGVAGEHTLRLEFETPGTAVYAFTFS
ncbi:MAG: cytochrome c biogenesis protein DipZ [Candidatus Moranbacteria bacterium]|nr:cytochrome c biogenesis protein DipZ [Candidatus Moranbacteria bacterium]